MVVKIMSGGQTGVDRAALDVALENDIACGGWCPKGRMAEDGVLDPKYPLVETELASYPQRTEANIRDSDGTLLLTWGKMSGGTLKTAAIANRLRRPLLIIKMDESPKIEEAEAWANHYNIRVLNIAGPRASEVASAYDEAKNFLTGLLVQPDEAEGD
jgi:hypothetical protein